MFYSTCICSVSCPSSGVAHRLGTTARVYNDCAQTDVRLYFCVNYILYIYSLWMINGVVMLYLLYYTNTVLKRNSILRII